MKKVTKPVTIRLTSETYQKLREYLCDMKKKGYRASDALALLLDAYGRAAYQSAKPLL